MLFQYRLGGESNRCNRSCMSPGSEDRPISSFEFEWGVIRQQDVKDIEWICARLQERRATLTGAGPGRRRRPKREAAIVHLPSIKIRSEV